MTATFTYSASSAAVSATPAKRDPDDRTITSRIIAIHVGLVAAVAVSVLGHETLDVSQRPAAQLMMVLVTVLSALLWERGRRHRRSVDAH